MKRFALFLGLSICVCGAPAPLTLAKKGQTAYTIVTAKEASPSERRGAAELQRFLNEITGAHFSVATDDSAPLGDLILVGRSRITDGLNLNIPFDKLGKEGFALKTSGRNLVIAGGRLRGTMYGVYTFLEKLGCRWVARDVSRIPKIPTLTVAPMDEIQKPSFEYREVHIGEGFGKDWAARNKTNGYFAALDESTGGKVKYSPWVHSFYSLVPPAKYFKDHPEYFSLVEGKRRGEQAQLCLTNPDVVRIAIESVSRILTERPEATISSVSQNDFGGQCECDNCRRVEREEGGSSAGPLIRFVNAVAEGVEKQHPDKLIDTLAYFYSETPPTKTRPRHNVRIRMCPIGACNAHPYEKCRHDAYIMNNLRAWAKITGNIYIWHYNANFSHPLLPLPDFDELAADIPMYKRNGVVGLFMQGTYTVGGADNALRAYLLARLLWDAGVDVEKVIDEFHEIYYGKAARPMRTYLDLVRKLARFAPEGEGQHWWCCRAPRFSEAQVAQANDLFRQALAAAENDAVRERVLASQMAMRYLELKRDQQFVVRGDRYEPRGLPTLAARFQAFLADAPKLGITSIGEEPGLEKDAKAFLDSLKSHRIRTMENASLKLQVVPELDGRVISIVDKRSGKELLNQPLSVEANYPNRTGLSVSAYPDFVNAAAIPIKWEVAPQSTGRELTLLGSAANGLRLRRLLRLGASDARLQTETVVENAGGSPVVVTLQSQFDGDPGPLDDAVVEFRASDGRTVRKKLMEPGAQPVGGDNYAGAARPNGEWRAVHLKSGLALVNTFPLDQADRASLMFLAKNSSRVTLALWTPKRTLKPGDSMRLNADYSAQQASR
jgi:hypothetical protein